MVKAGLLVTASHVVADAEAIDVQLATRDESERAVVEWLDQPTDVALLGVSSNSALGQQMSPALFNGNPAMESAAVFDASAVGFPRFSEHIAPEGNVVPDVAQIWGKVAPLSGVRSGTFEVLVESVAPTSTERNSPWSGMAGAPLWVDGQIVGIINAAAEDGKRLYAVRAERLLANLEFARLVDPDLEPASAAQKPTESAPVPSPEDSGDAAAPRDLGRLAEQGGRLDEAENWYRRAADSGDSAAQRDLGRLAEQGGRLDDYENWYRRWAEQRWGRLSPSSVDAFAYADGMRAALRQAEVHMEHLIVGLNQKEGGPTRRLLDQAGIGQAGLRAALAEAVEATLPPTVIPSELESLPRLSQHVAEALDRAVRLADEVRSPFVRTRHLLYGALSVVDCAVVQALGSRGLHASAIEYIEAPSSPAGETSVRPPLLAGAAADTVPEPGEGRVRAADRLGAEAEVEMLVSVLLAHDTPLPLAVGLFGDWGSGKSFFMALMQERMAELAQLAAQGRPEAAPFCKEIRQVRFNAWHYVDTNLWASLAANLFDELARAGAPQETQIKLTQLDDARDKVDQARTERQRLEREVGELAAVVNRPVSAVRASASVAIRAVRGDPQFRTKLRAAAEGRSAADDSTERLVSVLGEIDTVAAKARAGWRLFQEEVLFRRRWATLVTLVVLVGLAVLASTAASWSTGIKLLTLLGALAAGLSPALSGALRVLYLAREAREARELPLVQKRDELARARAVEEEAERVVAQRERELAELRDKGLQLQNFVRERAASSDYRDKLGVISQVRRDFEQLVALVPTGQPLGAEQVAAVATAMTRRVPEVQRIVLFIDDLDRCPHDKVVEVLQAVHLLLAFKLFVVVVGVDSRWLALSLREHYKNLLEEPDSYLEKIFQIPFTLQRMTRPRYRDLIEELTLRLGYLGQSADVTASADPVLHGRTAAPQTDLDSEDSSPASADDAGGRTVPGRSDGAGQAHETKEHGSVEPPPLPRPEALVISDAERALLGKLSGIVPTPRAAKRLVNIYRMLRVSVPDDELEAFRPGGGDEYQAVVLLLGVLVGRPLLAHEVFTSLMASADDANVWQLLRSFPDVCEPLANLRKDMTVAQAAAYRRWAPRVSRFSFRLAAVLPMDEPRDVAVMDHRSDEDASGSG